MHRKQGWYMIYTEQDGWGLAYWNTTDILSSWTRGMKLPVNGKVTQVIEAKITFPVPDQVEMWDRIESQVPNQASQLVYIKNKFDLIPKQ